MQIGSIDMAKVSASTLEGFVPTYKVLLLPYLYKNKKQRFAIWDGPIGQKILDSGQPYWIKGLVYYDSGSRSFYTMSKKIARPSDLTGLKIRTMESRTAIETVNALGGSATPIAWGELYTALQQGIVDGAENNPPSFYLSKHYEVCKYYSLDEHTAIPDVIIVSTRFWSKLSAQERKIIHQAALDSAQYQRVLWQKATDHAMEQVKKAGVKVFQVDQALFRAKVKNIYHAYKNETFYHLLEAILHDRDRPQKN